MTDFVKTAAMVLMCIAPAACVSTKKAEVTRELPVMGWDHRPEAPEWTQKTLLAVAEEDAELAEQVPHDIGQWCPGYPEAKLDDRRAFWAGLLSAVAKHESGWNPAAAGGGGQYIGLMQISPRTAQHYGCEAASSGALKDGAANLACAVDIAAVQVGRDDAVAGSGNAGLGRDWGPLKNAGKRAEIAAWTSAQPYCQKG